MFKEHIGIVRYDWPIDGRPSKLSFTKHGDVSGGVQVSVEGEGASVAEEVVLVSVGLSGIAALRAFLGGIARVDIHYRFTKRFGFIGDELIELPESPISQHSVEVFSEPLGPPYTKGFESNHIVGLVDYPFGDLVVCTGHKTFLPASEPFKATLGRTSSFGLELGAIVLVSGFDVSDVLAVIKKTVRKNGVVVYSGIHAENFGLLGSNKRRVISLRNHLELELFTIERETGSFEAPIEIRNEVIRDTNREFDATMYAAERYCGSFAIERECSDIIPDGGELALDWQAFEFLALEHVRGTIPRSASQVCREAVLCPDIVISCVMELELVESFCIEASLENIVAGVVECFYCQDVEKTLAFKPVMNRHRQ